MTYYVCLFLLILAAHGPGRRIFAPRIGKFFRHIVVDTCVERAVAACDIVVVLKLHFLKMDGLP